tara:strand:- start:5037 stop:5771 length:735 start_codon:yes stop_codon:yes gene_type:complete
MPNFLPARIVPFVFSGSPTPTDNYDVLNYASPNLIAPFELGINELNNSLVLESNGEIHEFFASGSTITYTPTTGLTGSYVLTSGDTMTGDLIMSASSIYIDNNEGILFSNSAVSGTVGCNIQLIDEGRLQISAETKVELFSDVSTTGNIELIASQVEWQNGAFVSTLAPAALTDSRTWDLPNISGELLVVPTSGKVEIPYLNITGYIDIAPRPTAPVAFTGRIYFNSVDNTMYCYDGTNWNALY